MVEGQDPTGDGAREVCLCFHVTLGMLARHAKGRVLRHASQLADCGGAGTGCGWCRPQLEAIARQLVESPGKLPKLPFDAREYAARRARAHAERAVLDAAEPLADELEP